MSGAVNQAVGEALTYYLEEHPKEAKIIVDKVVLAATARVAARKARESVQRKSPMGGGGLPGKLADCSRVILQVVQPSKEEAVSSRPSCHCAVKF